MEGSGHFAPLFQSPGQTRWNIDGRLAYVGAWPDQSAAAAYTQLFRNGIFEGVDTRALRPDDDEAKFVHGGLLEHGLNTMLANPLEVLRTMGVTPPIAVRVTIIGARGYRLRTPVNKLVPYETDEINRDVVSLPDVVLASFGDYEVGLPRLMRPVLDAFWQSSGFPYSFYYDAEGNWTGR